MSKEVFVRSFTATELNHWLHSVEFAKLKNIPISTHRAMSQLKNPFLAANDQLLFCIFEQGELQAYLGALPIFLTENSIKAATLSCLWVNSETRGRGLAKILLQAANSAWENKLFMTEYTPEAAQLYYKSGFFNVLTTLRGRRFYLQSNLSKHLGRRKPHLKTLFSLVDKTANCLINVPNLFIHKPQLNLVRIHFVNESMQPIMDAKSYLFANNIARINWIIQNPWVLNGTTDESSKRYYFSSYDRHFEFLLYELKNDKNETDALLLFSNRNGSFKLPFFYSKVNLTIISLAIKQILLEQNALDFTCFQNDLNQALTRTLGFSLHQKAMCREYLIGKNLVNQINTSEIYIQDGDLDCAFT